jgi:hypothetical protein
MYGHIQKLAEAEKEGLKKAGIDADLYQYVFTLSYIHATRSRNLVRPIVYVQTADPSQSSRDTPRRGLGQGMQHSR